jgi:ribosomal protein S18 acetylase RimI-like enzyme
MVRQAKIDDLAAVAKIHMACFPGTVTSSLGKLWKGRIIVDYYKEYFNDCPELFLVAENNSGEVVGFCMGYKLEAGNIDKRLIKHDFWRIMVGYGYLLLLGDKECWRKVKGYFKCAHKKGNSISIVEPAIDVILDTAKVELFTIGLYEEYRGKRYGNDLILSYFDVCKFIGRKICLISYLIENEKVERFYYRHGCKPYLINGEVNKICYKEIY